jgi:hypothetical protein
MINDASLKVGHVAIWLPGSKDFSVPSLKGVGESLDMHSHVIESFTVHSFFAIQEKVEIGYGAL